MYEGIHAPEEPADSAKDSMMDLLTALRFLGEGLPDYTEIIRTVKIDFPGLGKTRILNVKSKYPDILHDCRKQHNSTYNPVCIITKNKTTSLRKMYDLVLNYKNKLVFVKIASNRFNYAYERKFKEDKIIDFAICLEVMFSHGSHDSLSHKLRIRCSRLIEKNYQKRVGISKDS